MNHILPLRDFLHEQEVSEQSYRFVVIYNDPSNVGDDSKEETDPLIDKMLSYGKELGLTWIIRIERKKKHISLEKMVNCLYTIKKMMSLK